MAFLIGSSDYGITPPKHSVEPINSQFKGLKCVLDYQSLEFFWYVSCTRGDKEKGGLKRKEENVVVIIIIIFIVF